MEIVCIYTQTSEHYRLLRNYDWEIHIPRSAANNGLVTYISAKEMAQNRTALCWA
jgi:hypothetical protein